MNEREKLMKRVQQCGFALIEIGMFLDTHPNDTAALECYQKYRAMYEKAMEDYTKRFGALNLTGVSDGMNKWEWINGPWPWEGADK